MTAVGGKLTFTNAVDAVGAATRFHIGASGDLVFKGAVGAAGAAAVNPTVTFDSTVATLDTSRVAANNLHLGGIANFQAGDIFQAQAYGAGDTLSFNSGSDQLDPVEFNGKRVRNLPVVRASRDL